MNDFFKFNQEELAAMLLTLKLAFFSMLILIIIATPMAWWLTHSRLKIKKVISTLLSLPLVIPPTVLGFYLLILLGPKSFLRPMFNFLGVEKLSFSFVGILIGASIFSFPLVLRPIQNAMETIGKKYEDLASTMGASPLDRFFTISIPLAKNGIINGAITGFAHTIGEFGVVLMIGGSIPNETKVLSITIFEEVESLNFFSAHKLSIIVLLFSGFCLYLLERLKEKNGK